jgi:hypothetical protein
VSAAGGVVFLTAMPLSGLLIGAGALDGRPSEVLAGLLVAALVGLPLLIAGLRARGRPIE